MTAIPRTDTSLLGRWWWTVDHWSLAGIIVLVAIGAVLALAASPPVTARLGIPNSYHFVERQFVFLPLAFLVMLGVSLFSPAGVKRIAAIGLVVSLALMGLALLTGPEINGAHRWLSLGKLNVQPSEFAKPFLAVMTAWALSTWRMRDETPGHVIAFLLFSMTIALLALQPDVGMAVVVSCVFAVQFFIAGLPMALVVATALIFTVLGISSYFLFDHVKSRVDRFLDPSSGDNYQVEKSIDAFRNGGLFGAGPGEGRVKESLPDAHTDFIFAVAGEEFGFIACAFIILLFAFLMLRGFSRVWERNNLFVIIATAGLLAQLSLQAIINMASALRLIPTKGMTLPFISYGGSSLLAVGIAMGMILALTRTGADEGGGR